MDSRLRALADLDVAGTREGCGRHEYDGTVQDLSPDGVRMGLARLNDGPAYPDPHDEAHVVAFEQRARVALGDLALHRRNPLAHLSNLDLACYDREYAPAAERAEARARHLTGWPDAVDASIEALDAVPAAVAEASLGSATGLAAGLDPVKDAKALAAQQRLVEHLTNAAATSEAPVELGADGLTALLSSAEALPVNLTELAAAGQAELDRLRALLDDACARIAPGQPTATTVRTLLADHPDISGVISTAQAETYEAIAWSNASGLFPETDGECYVGPAPESRQWAMAMMDWAAPFEPDAPSWYHVTPPDPAWPAAEQAEWLSVFNSSSLPAITVHEVAPGHYTHGRALRRLDSDVRRLLLSDAFVEGWAHYVEEVALEQGFRDGDPRFAAGVALEALVRVVRLLCAIGLHTGSMTVPDATALFTEQAFLSGPAALSEARRGTFDPTYGRYTWGKLVLRDLRARTRSDLREFHQALLSLGAPPLGLAHVVVE
ncbi:DUF885 family protein [Cryptosporangium phraense]|uniref:DUF885 domain-containing protein n=1 Tax=Cryptosporangium phraense TaxID=2593070 RepID=A0A545ASA7_9ACTN|nr:DUF885 family protein [Cryptosporangium phraense]TQS44199.1 DUF885 domain-containing protein [Cryptosporangium phraense]